MLVLSSFVNGLINVVGSYSAGQPDTAALDLVLTITSVLWWKEANDPQLLSYDQLAILATFSAHGYHIHNCRGG